MRPLLVMIGCGPTSTRNSPKVPGPVGVISGTSLALGSQWIRSSDQACQIDPSPKYITYRPSIGTGRIAPALLHGPAWPRPCGRNVLNSGNSGPCLVQVSRSVD